MVNVKLLPDSTMVLDGVTYTEPGDYYGASVTFGSTTYASGTVVVTPTAINRHSMELQGYATVAVFILPLYFILGLFYSRLNIRN